MDFFFFFFFFQTNRFYVDAHVSLNDTNYDMLRYVFMWVDSNIVQKHSYIVLSFIETTSSRRMAIKMTSLATYQVTNL